MRHHLQIPSAPSPSLAVGPSPCSFSRCRLLPTAAPPAHPICLSQPQPATLFLSRNSKLEVKERIFIRRRRAAREMALDRCAPAVDMHLRLLFLLSELWIWSSGAARSGGPSWTPRWAAHGPPRCEASKQMDFAHRRRRHGTLDVRSVATQVGGRYCCSGELELPNPLLLLPWRFPAPHALARHVHRLRSGGPGSEQMHEPEHLCCCCCSRRWTWSTSAAVRGDGPGSPSDGAVVRGDHDQRRWTWEEIRNQRVGRRRRRRRALLLLGGSRRCCSGDQEPEEMDLWWIPGVLLVLPQSSSCGAQPNGAAGGAPAVELLDPDGDARSGAGRRW